MTVATPYRTRLRYLRHITLWSLLLFVVLVFVSVALELVRHRSAPLPAVVVLAAAAVGSCAMSGYFMIGSVGSGEPMTRRIRAAFALAATGAALSLVVSPALDPSASEAAPQWLALPGVLTAAAVAGSGLPKLPTTLVGIAVTTLAAAAGAALADYPVRLEAAIAAIVVVLCTASVAVQVWFWDVAAQLDRARQAEGEAAVAGERLRFAAELHDIQGHSLQVIALKSELAARLVGTDPSRAVVEMREVESLARQALRDTREVAHGYRTVSLITEIANATRVLAAAGVRCATRQDDDLPRLAPAEERLLGLVVREATTNVIRHSRATQAEIALVRRDGGVRLRVGNDAPLAATEPSTSEQLGTPSAGGGLAGLAERFAAAGGALRWCRAGDTFTVTAEVASR